MSLYASLGGGKRRVGEGGEIPRTVVVRLTSSLFSCIPSPPLLLAQTSLHLPAALSYMCVKTKDKGIGGIVGGGRERCGGAGGSAKNTRRVLASLVFPFLVVLSTYKRYPKSRFYKWEVPQAMAKQEKPR